MWTNHIRKFRLDDVTAVLLALAAGGFAFERMRAADAAIAQLDAQKAAADKARADLLAAQAERDSLRKKAAELDEAAGEMRAGLEAQRKLLEAEKANSIRLQEDLTMTRSRLAAASARQGRSADSGLPPGVLPPGLIPIQRQPIAVRIAPGSGSAANAAANAVPAR